MKKTKNDLIYIKHILNCMEKIFVYVEGYTFEDFTRDMKTYDSVLRNLQILSESVQRLSDATKKEFDSIPWKDISGFRNIIVHDYLEGIDSKIIWDIISDNLESLHKELLVIQSHLINQQHNQ